MKCNITIADDRRYWWHSHWICFVLIKEKIWVAHVICCVKTYTITYLLLDALGTTFFPPQNSLYLLTILPKCHDFKRNSICFDPVWNFYHSLGRVVYINIYMYIQSTPKRLKCALFFKMLEIRRQCNFF